MATAAAADLGVAVPPCLLGDRVADLVRLIDKHHGESIWLVAPIELARTKSVPAVVRFVADVVQRNPKSLRGHDVAQTR